MTVPVTGDAVSSFLAAHDVPSDPARHPLRVYLDGEHVGTRNLTSGDLASGPRLATPGTDLSFGDEFTAAGAYAALVDPAGSIVTIGRSDQ